jgi:hypothetical protein
VLTVAGVDGKFYTDFNEALNPNISLKDIMADLMEEKPEEEFKQYSSENNQIAEIKTAERESKIQLLESGFIRTPALKKTTVQVNQKTIDPIKAKPTFEKRFLSIQNITKE